ncbi:ACP phosphodiesterase [Mucilaginibacter lacusdianchii]|uniref:ACP phosphodiesterase n=1 Tax=Mucilaginibacter lacusdianchii TaxID=2684211 RepID=UPI00131BA4C5|nr:ACP phosphodiesterase [Mucilaginibacter sp. JXJ CY 39]
MNFLSHYYFDRDTSNCYHVLGTVLPDLLKNADKNIVLHPEKLQHPHPAIRAMIGGWKKHLEIDRHFHSSDFFVTHSHQLKLQLRPVIEGSPVKPFFLGHIALELILDSLLLTTGQVLADDFYEHLNSCNQQIISEFLAFSGMAHPEVFIRFFEKFKKERYLHSYAQTEQIAYALKRICMRIWNNPFTPEQEAGINDEIITYRNKLESVFMNIFDYIQVRLVD